MAAEGPAELAGPDDDLPGLDREAVRLLLRAIFSAAGGTNEVPRRVRPVMAAERRAAVLVNPTRLTASTSRR